MSLKDKIIKFERGSYPKKYKVYLNSGQIIQFGDQRYQQYKDSTPLKLYSHLDHLDKERKELYYRRFGKESKPYTAKWFSHRYLWM